MVDSALQASLDTDSGTADKDSEPESHFRENVLPFCKVLMAVLLVCTSWRAEDSNLAAWKWRRLSIWRRSRHPPNAGGGHPERPSSGNWCLLERWQSAMVGSEPSTEERGRADYHRGLRKRSNEAHRFGAASGAPWVVFPGPRWAAP